MKWSSQANVRLSRYLPVIQLRRQGRTCAIRQSGGFGILYGIFSKRYASGQCHTSIAFGLHVFLFCALFREASPCGGGRPGRGVGLTPVTKGNFCSHQKVQPQLGNPHQAAPFFHYLQPRMSERLNCRISFHLSQSEPPYLSPILDCRWNISLLLAYLD